MLPVMIDSEPYNIATITYKPAGAGPFPILVFHHGSTGTGKSPSWFSRPFEPFSVAYWFVSRGWAVVFPSRRGRGGSEGLYDEGFASDRTNGYTCEEALSLRGADRALRDIDAITRSVLALPFVDPTRFLVGGQSRGGTLAIAWAGRHPDQPLGVINFVGGWVGARCPTAIYINQHLFSQGVVFPRPTLWLYGDNDPFYPLSHSRANFEKFREAGGKGTFHEVEGSSVSNGHQIINLDDAWSPIVEAYLGELGLPFAETWRPQRQAMDEEIRAAFSGKIVEWAPGAVAEYGPDGSYKFTVTAKGSMPSREVEGRYWITGGQLCAESSNGRRRCDKIMKTEDGYYMITASGDRYRAKVR